MISHPLIKFPEPKPSAYKNGLCPGSGKPFRVAPCDGISTSDIAKLMRCSASAARNFMLRHGVKRMLVTQKGSPEMYWSKKQADELLAQRPVLVNRIPAGYVGTKDAVIMLGKARSVIQRLAGKGVVRSMKVRLRSKRGTREYSVFLKSDILKFKAVERKNSK